MAAALPTVPAWLGIANETEAAVALAPCVDINTAPSEELQEIIHVGPARARQIVALREDRPFEAVEDLVRVKGIGPARIRDIVAEGVACVDVALPDPEEHATASASTQDSTGCRVDTITDGDTFVCDGSGYACS